MVSQYGLQRKDGSTSLNTTPVSKRCLNSSYVQSLNLNACSYLQKTKDFAAIAEFPELRRLGLASNLVVHYGEVSDRDGFIVTAFQCLT